MVRKLKKTVISTNPILIKMTDDEYVINYGQETVSIMERYYKGLDLLANDNLEEAELIFKSLVNGVRAYYDSIIALINIFSERGDFPNISKIYNVGVRDMKLILDTLPENATLPFTYASNKGFLKFLYKLGIKHINTSRIDDAITNFLLLLKLNPADEFDIIEVLAGALFEKEDYDKVIELTENLDNQKNPSTIYNRILAFLKMGNKEKALELINNLKEENLKIYKDLNPENDYAMDISEYISLSVIDDKSKYYWNNYYRYWKEKEEYLEFLNLNIKDTTDISANEKNFIKSFENYLIQQDLKENTIKNHMENVEIFKENLENFDKIREKLIELKTSTSKSSFGKYFTTLNKYYSFVSKDYSKDFKEKLKELKTQCDI